MELDLDKELASLPPWDFTVRIAGVCHAIRRPSLADHDTIRIIDRMKDEAVFEFIYSLFADPRPSASLLTRDSLRTVLVNLIAYDALRRNPFYDAAKDRVIKRMKHNVTLARAASAALRSPLN